MPKLVFKRTTPVVSSEFLAELQDVPALLDWECTVLLDGTLQVLKLSGIRTEGNLLVMGDPQAITLQHILMEAGQACSQRHRGAGPAQNRTV